MAIKKAIDKLHEVVGGNKDTFSDGSASWVAIENENFEVCFTFDGSGKKLTDIKISQKIWEIVDQKMITTIKLNQ